jgi:TRAP-type C4-dicarboxylate transport system permease small subunit
METFRAWLIVRRLGEVAIMLLFAGMIASAMLQVVARYVFNSPFTWSEELSRYLFIWLSFLGAWWAWIRREHLGIDALPHMLPVQLRRHLLRLIELSVLVFALASMVYGQRILQVSIRQPSAVLWVPMFWIYVSYYVAMTLITAEILLGWLYGRLHPAPESGSESDPGSASEGVL